MRLGGPYGLSLFIRLIVGGYWLWKSFRNHLKIAKHTHQQLTTELFHSLYNILPFISQSIWFHI